MHYYKFNIGDYRAATTHLSPLEHYIYRSLIDWYYLNEKPFEGVEQVARLLMLSSDDEIRTIQSVLDEFFNLHKGRYYHKRIRQEVKDFKAGKYYWDENGNESNGNNKNIKKSLESNGQGNEKITESNGQDNAQNNDKKALSNSERQARYKEKKRMLQALSDKGISVDDNADFWQVCEIFIANFPPTDNEKLETITQSDNESNETKSEKNGARTINHKPITINQESERVSVTTDTPHAHAHTFQKSNSNEPNQTPTHHSYQEADKPIPLPQDFEFSKNHLAKCKEFGFDIKTLFEKFKNHCLSKNKRSYNWESEFLLWINREIDFTKDKSSAPAGAWSGFSATNNQTATADPYAKFGGYMGYVQAIQEGRA